MPGTGGVMGGTGGAMPGTGGSTGEGGSLADLAGPPIRASQMLGASEEFGLPPASFAEIHPDGAGSLGHMPLMQRFASSVGGPQSCNACHSAGFGSITDNTRIAIHMWDDILGQLEFANGDPLFCDSCHQGQPTFLDRSNLEAVSAWMQENMVNKLKRRDNQPHDCNTCHGVDPLNFGALLDIWAAN